MTCRLKFSSERRSHITGTKNYDIHNYICVMTKLGQQIAIGYYRTKFKVLSALSTRKAAELALDLFTTQQFRYRKQLPEIFKEAEKLQFKHFGETVTGYRWNRGGHRRALIVHGFNSSVAKFDRYVRPLMRKGYEVLAFDAPA